MSFACNIDRRGRRARGIMGVLLILAGAGLLLGALAESRWVGEFLGAGIILTAAGAFALFESLKGWCALRALGIKTSL